MEGNWFDDECTRQHRLAAALCLPLSHASLYLSRAAMGSEWPSRSRRWWIWSTSCGARASALARLAQGIHVDAVRFSVILAAAMCGCAAMRAQAGTPGRRSVSWLPFTAVKYIFGCITRIDSHFRQGSGSSPKRPPPQLRSRFTFKSCTGFHCDAAVSV